MGRDLLGELEHQVLLVVLRHGRESYSVDIVAEIEECTGREIAVSAVFVVLKRLEEKGLLDSRMVDPGDRGGHARRYFRLTARGLEALRETRRAYVALWDGVEAALDP